MIMENTATIKNLQVSLKFTYGLVPMIAGLDHYTNLLVNWDTYLSPGISGLLPIFQWCL